MNNTQRRRAAKLKARSERRAAFKAAAESGKERKDNERRARFNAHKHEHVIADCGNVGCGRCYPRGRLGYRRGHLTPKGAAMLGVTPGPVWFQADPSNLSRAKRIVRGEGLVGVGLDIGQTGVLPARGDR